MSSDHGDVQSSKASAGNDSQYKEQKPAGDLVGYLLLAITALFFGSAPTFASVVSALNRARLAKGRPTVGFLAPLLYAMAAACFHDVARGSNRCTEGACCEYGFSSAAGRGLWDPVVGRGSPSVAQMLAWDDATFGGA